MDETYMLVAHTELTEADAPAILPPHKPWITLSLYFPEDLATIKERSPEAFEGAPEIGHEGSLVVLHHNHVATEDLPALLEAALASLKDTEVPE